MLDLHLTTVVYLYVTTVVSTGHQHVTTIVCVPQMHVYMPQTHLTTVVFAPQTHLITDVGAPQLTGQLQRGTAADTVHRQLLQHIASLEPLVNVDSGTVSSVLELLTVTGATMHADTLVHTILPDPQTTGQQC